MLKMLVIALFALTLAPGSDEDVVQRLHIRFDTYDVSAESCGDAVTRNPEPGFASIQFRYTVADGHWLAPQRYTGKVTFALGDLVIHQPAKIAWPHMSLADHARARELRRAIEHHEIGHVRIAEAVRDALNAEQQTIVSPDVFAFGAEADARGRDGFARFRREERAYDELTDHGRRQHVAPGVLGGPDTELICR